jgi:hypothetical protein
MLSILYVRKIALPASEGKKRKFATWPGRLRLVPYYADNVFADQTEQYPEIGKSLTGSREYVLPSFMLLYFFWDFCFLCIKSTQRGGWLWMTMEREE